MAVVLLLISVLYTVDVLSLEYVTVNTTLGPITGYKDNVSNSELQVFLGIPYAKPPVGNLRFKAPLPFDPWNTTYKATSLPKSCPQIPYPDPSYFQSSYFLSSHRTLTTPISEDCLYLNIWVPVSGSSAPKAVMLWIHGGSFTRGSTSETMFDGRILATQSDVIVVTINYRLGIFGFLYFGMSDVPGNMGLMDQYMAIKWVYDNIGTFGGDPHRITIFGISAGGNSVAYQLITTQPKYFTRAIMESTASILSFGFYTPPQSAKELSLQYAATLGCSAVDLVNTTSCLRSLNVTFILSMLPSPLVVPTTDGVFLTTSPYQLSQLTEVRNIDILAGITVDDGYPILYETMGLTPFFKDNQPISSLSEFTKLASAVTNLSVTVMDTCLPETYGYTTYNDSKIALVALATDLQFTCQCQAYAEAFDMNGNTVYRYRFDYGGSFRNLPSWVGAGHTDELVFVFGHPLNMSFGNFFNDYEVTLAELVISYWTNFTKYGNPNGLTLAPRNGTYWPRFTDDHQLQLIFTSHGVEIGTFTSQSECEFWNSVYPALLTNSGQYESLCATVSISSASVPVLITRLQIGYFLIYCIIATQYVMLV